MHMSKVALGLATPAPPSWWLLAEEALSPWVTRCAAKAVAEDAAGTPGASLIAMMLSGSKGIFGYLSCSSLLRCPTAEPGHCCVCPG